MINNISDINFYGIHFYGLGSGTSGWTGPGSGLSCTVVAGVECGSTPTVSMGSGLRLRAGPSRVRRSYWSLQHISSRKDAVSQAYESCDNTSFRSITILRWYPPPPLASLLRMRGGLCHEAQLPSLLMLAGSNILTRPGPPAVHPSHRYARPTTGRKNRQSPLQSNKQARLLSAPPPALPSPQAPQPIDDGRRRAGGALATPLWRRLLQRPG